MTTTPNHITASSHYDHEPTNPTTLRASIESADLEAIDAVVASLTTPSGYTNLEMMAHSPDFSPEVLSDRATQLVNALEAAGKETHLSEEKRLLIDEAIENGDHKILKKLGFNAEYTEGITYLVAALLHGRPPVDLEAFSPYAYKMRGGDGKIKFDPEKIPREEVIGLALAVLCKKLATSINTPLREVVFLDDLNDPEGIEITDAEKNQYVADIGEYFKSIGLIDGNDQMGQDILVIRESTQEGRVQDLITALEKCGQGEVKEVVTFDNQTNEEVKAVIFVPNSEFIDSLGIKDKSHRKNLKRGITLSLNGRPLCQALDAATYLGSDGMTNENSQLIHAVFVDKRHDEQQDRVFTLLSALKIVRPETYHNIITDKDVISPDEAVYAVTRLLKKELMQFKSTVAPSNPRNRVQ